MFRISPSHRSVEIYCAVFCDDYFCCINYSLLTFIFSFLHKVAISKAPKTFHHFQTFFTLYIYHLILILPIFVILFAGIYANATRKSYDTLQPVILKLISSVLRSVPVCTTSLSIILSKSHHYMCIRIHISKFGPGTLARKFLSSVLFSQLDQYFSFFSMSILVLIAEIHDTLDFSIGICVISFFSLITITVCVLMNLIGLRI